MKQIEKILNRISLLFYIFVGLFALGSVYDFVSGIVLGIRTADSTVNYHISTNELIVQAVLAFVLMVAIVISLVIFVKLLISIGRSIAKKNIFVLRTVDLINKYAIFNGVSIALNLILSLFFVEIGGENGTVEVFKYSSIIESVGTLVMLLMFGQVLKIGFILKKDQDLTI